ncbi:MAG: patatin-like phospholipase family protein [Acidobacteriota bacterium]
MQRLASTTKPRSGKNGGANPRPPFECIALLLQGGGSLGAYQGGVYQALAEHDLQPDWVAGISIGAVNAAIIAGNSPEKRVDQLRAFWDRVTGNPLGSWADPWLSDGGSLAGVGDVAHGLLDRLSAIQAAVAGAPGFFKPRFPPAWLFPPGCPESTSFYDTAALKATLESLVDFDRINSKAMRFSVGATNVRTGNFVYFDTATHTIRPEHILASGALPPGFPAIEIEGEYYWDGGLVSNTPLQWVVDSEPRHNMLAFQIDLWSSRGKFPRDLTEVAVRQKEIQFSSRTRANTDRLKHIQKIRSTLSKLLRDAPASLRKTAEAKFLTEFADLKAYNIVHLIYRAMHYEGNSKDCEFSRLSMADHWRAGHADALRALQHTEIFERPKNEDGFQAFDFGGPGRTGRDPVRRQGKDRS